MTWEYNYLDHAADIAVDIKADSIEELFAGAAIAWRESVTDSTVTEQASDKVISLEEQTLEILLVSFLNELNYLFQHRNWIMNSIKHIELSEGKKSWKLIANITGTRYVNKNLLLKYEIKAITYHQMEIKEHEGKFSTRIVFDI